MSLGQAQPINWHLVSAQYPSTKSSIGAYSLTLAEGLGRLGHKVHIWHSNGELMPPLGPPHSKSDRKLFTSHDLPIRWNHKTLAALSRRLDATPTQRRLFVQFDPRIFAHNWNLDLAHWLKERHNKGDEIWVMIHKVVEPFSTSMPGLHHLWTWLQRRMLSRVLAHTDRIFVPTTYWQPWVEPLVELPGDNLTWLPMPSHVAWVENRQRAQNLRKAFAHQASVVVGTFGSYHDEDLTDLLVKLIPQILQGHGERVWLCLGRGSEEFTRKLRRKHPALARQIATAGELDPAALSAHVQACDLMLQPYPLGVNATRSSVMVGLSHGRPIVTTSGPRTENIWLETGCVQLPSYLRLDEMVAAVDTLIADPDARLRLSQRARSAYADYFSLERCLNTLLSLA